MRRGNGDTIKLRVSCIVRRFAVRPRMQFDNLSTKSHCASTCSISGSMNNDTFMPAAPSWRTNGARRLCAPATSSPPSVRFLTFLGNDAGSVGHMVQRNFQHFVGSCHFKIKRQVNFAGKTKDIVVCHVLPILAKMRRDTIGPRRGRHKAARTGSDAHRRGHSGSSPYDRYLRQVSGICCSSGSLPESFGPSVAHSLYQSEPASGYPS